jgi:hypothetical protein
MDFIVLLDCVCLAMLFHLGFLGGAPDVLATFCVDTEVTNNTHFGVSSGSVLQRASVRF